MFRGTAITLHAARLLAVVLAACSPGKATPSSTDSIVSDTTDTNAAPSAGTLASATSSTSGSSSTPATTTSDLTTSTTGETSSGGDTTSTGTGAPCWYSDNDCPAGYKCEAADDDCTRPKCKPIPPRAKEFGELCEHDTHTYCLGDNCGPGLFCAVNLGKTCVTPCVNAECPVDQSCWFEFAGLGGCALQCDPLLQDCPPGMACDYNYQGGFSCMALPDRLAGLLDSCPNDNECAPGLHCDISPACLGACCTPLCDSTQPDACATVPGTTCTVYGATDPPGREHIGACR
jgi:hypothetical protein